MRTSEAGRTFGGGGLGAGLADYWCWQLAVLVQATRNSAEVSADAEVAGTVAGGRVRRVRSSQQSAVRRRVRRELAEVGTNTARTAGGGGGISSLFFFVSFHTAL